jgi:FtsP/CotA-like multicopper oxidase with cupredoxin domain
MPPLAQENGWKDTVIMYPGQVTRIMVRWAPTDEIVSSGAPGANLAFPFNPNSGHGYVWHCHIIDHEDNEMMRPTSVTLNTSAPIPANRLLKQGTDY